MAEQSPVMARRRRGARAIRRRGLPSTGDPGRLRQLAWNRPDFRGGLSHCNRSAASPRPQAFRRSRSASSPSRPPASGSGFDGGLGLERRGSRALPLGHRARQQQSGRTCRGRETCQLVEGEQDRPSLATCDLRASWKLRREVVEDAVCADVLDESHQPCICASARTIFLTSRRSFFTLATVLRFCHNQGWRKPSATQTWAVTRAAGMPVRANSGASGSIRNLRRAGTFMMPAQEPSYERRNGRAFEVARCA